MDEVKEKRHNTADTSREAYIDLTNTGRLIDEKKKVYELLKTHGALNSRQISNLLKVERTNVTRSLYDLLHEITPSIKEAFTAKCPTTNRTVKFYSVVNAQPLRLFQ